ncbi:SPOR domain-containing protein [Parasphingorhabdus sp. DH2-15]|uniref:SPOR domain-containing protein n=1 Tax=Parasphingorhabdus sp. DH2-15 TaxID=3444112 RepID=UPI003F686FC2
MTALLLTPGAVLAQPDQSAGANARSAQAPHGAQKLQSALKRLASNSKDLSALIDAGNAAMQMGDPVASLGFFARADIIAPRNPLVKAGLGSALLGNENPYEALLMFNQAIELGASREKIALDRGLAYDLVGKQDFAQDDYRFLLSRNGNNPEAIRRFALSLGIAGKKTEAESLLTSLLYANDRAAWRIRAFVLAINEDIDGALAITRGSLQPRTARAIEPFFRYMPKLTPSQQAAAAHFGHFPQEANIGRDNPRNGDYAALDPSRTPDRILGTRADAGLIPAGEPLGGNASEARAAKPKPSRKPRRRPGRKISDPDKINAIVNAEEPPKPAPETAGPAFASLADEPATSFDLADAGTGADNSANSSSGASDNSQPAIAATSQDTVIAKAVTPQPAPVQVVSASSAVAASAPNPAPASESTSAPRKPAFAELMRSIAVPEKEITPDDQAVDITAITPAKAKPKPKPKPKEPPKPEHPSRIWVQVAGGADTNALKFEWRRLVKKAPDSFKDLTGWTTPLNKTNRVLAGPFDSKKAAQDFVNRLAKNDISAFTFTSAEGQVINKLN